LVDNLEAGNADIKSMLEDKDGNIWGNQGGGLFKLKDKINYFESYLVNTSDPVHTLYKDRNEITQKIINYYKGYAIKNSLVYSIDEDKS